jgi:hypothetical protein
MNIENKREFCKEKLNLKLDNWQENLINAENQNIVIRAGRQVGKSTGVALKAFFYAINNPEKTILIIAQAQRAAGLLFEKVKSIFLEICPEEIAEEPTMTRLVLENKTRIYCLPAGRTGYAIRGYSVDLLIADEAAYIPDPVWVAVVPMLAVTKGNIILLSTPWGKGGYFYECCFDKDFLSFHLNSEDCPRIPASFLEKERRRLSKVRYAQEYLGEFVEDYTQFFPTSLIKDRSTFIEWDYDKKYNPKLSYYLGVDVARYGGDENAYIIIEMKSKRELKVIRVLTTSRLSTTDAIGRVIKLNEHFKFKRIFIDDAGVGGGITDVLIEKLGRKVKGINNSSRPVDKEGKRKKILKEDLYSNLIVLMENKFIEFLDDPQLKRSLSSVQFEYTSDRSLKIYGSYTHLAEALVRAAWCVRDRGQDLFCYSFR